MHLASNVIPRSPRCEVERYTAHSFFTTLSARSRRPRRDRRSSPHVCFFRVNSADKRDHQLKTWNGSRFWAYRSNARHWFRTPTREPVLEARPLAGPLLPQRCNTPSALASLQVASALVAAAPRPNRVSELHDAAEACGPFRHGVFPCMCEYGSNRGASAERECEGYLGAEPVWWKSVALRIDP